MITVKNPWHRKDGPYSKPTFTYDRAPVFSYRGVDVYKCQIGSFDYVLGDTAITQRAGFRKESAPELIDSILDGLAPASDPVVSHLRNNGFKGLTFDEYMQAWAKGEME